jgi:hypothetical protein
VRKRVKGIGILLAGLLLAMQAVAGVAGASAPGTTAITFRVQPRIELTLSTSTVNFGDVTPGTLTFAGALMTTVRSNTLWSLTASAPNFSDGATTPQTLPIDRLSTRTGIGSYTAFPLTGALTLLSGQPRGGNRQNTWDYQLVIDWEDALAAYSTTITYTAFGS